MRLTRTSTTLGEQLWRLAEVARIIARPEKDIQRFIEQGLLTLTWTKTRGPMVARESIELLLDDLARAARGRESVPCYG